MVRRNAVLLARNDVTAELPGDVEDVPVGRQRQLQDLDVGGAIETYERPPQGFEPARFEPFAREPVTYIRRDSLRNEQLVVHGPDAAIRVVLRAPVLPYLAVGAKAMREIAPLGFGPHRRSFGRGEAPCSTRG